MNETGDRVRRLIEKLIKGEELSESEIQELKQFSSESLAQKEFMEELGNKKYLETQLERFDKVNVDEAYARFAAGAQSNTSSAIRVRRRMLVRLAAAASVILLLASGIYLWQQTGSKSKVLPIAKIQDFSPGGNRAVLRVSKNLEEGPVFLLDSAKDGALIAENNLSVVKPIDGLIEYKVSDPGVVTGEVEYHTISTPVGGQYQVVLSDGTKIWLNAASSIRFPSRFVGSERKVQITGEAYFEVAKDPSRPFLVAKNDMQIQVLGTHFNVNAYDDEPTLNTTLLEGSVNIKSGKDAKILKPGEQARVSSDGKLKIVTNVKLDQVVAWKNGTFRFDETSLQAIMRQVSRWYDVQIEYRGDIPDMKFMGGLSRYANATEVIKLLEMTGGFKASFEGRKIIIQP